MVTPKIEGNKVVYTPTLGYAGVETLSYTVTDNYSAEQTASITITVENVDPVANNDDAFVEIDQATLLDVLGNDQDVAGDTLTIESVSAPQNGSVEIVEGQIRYQPNAGYEGDDTFGYTIVDSHGASDSAFVSLKVTNKLVLQGKLVGYEKAGTVVTFKHGDATYSTTTDAQGNYRIELAIQEPNKLVIAYADNAAANYHLRGYLGTLTSLLLQDEDADDTVSNIHLSDLTTAEYELVFKLLDNAEANSTEELITTQFDADNYFQMQMAISSDIINSNNGIVLPVGFNSVNEFIRSSTDMSQQLARWRTNQTNAYHDAFAKLMDNADLATYPQALTNNEVVLAESPGFLAVNYSPGYTYSLSINGTSATYAEKYPANVSRVGNRLNLEFFSDKPTDRQFQTYCEQREFNRASFNYLNFNAIEMVKIYATSNYDLYLQKIDAEVLHYSGCDFTVASFYNVARVYHKQPLHIAAGDYFINVQKAINVGLENESYEYEVATITLNENGSFIDTNDVSNTLTGTWTNTDDELTLSYNDGRHFTYFKAVDMNGSPQLIGTARVNGNVVSVFDSDLFEQIPFTWSHTTGYLSYDVYPIIDPVINKFGRFNFKNDGLANYEWVSVDDEIESSALEYGWQLEGNKYTMTRYGENNAPVSFCDVAQVDCFLYIRRGMEIVGSNNGVYYVKGFYTRFNEDGTVAFESNSVYQVLFTPQ